MVVEELRKKLEEAIEKYGVESKEAYRLSIMLDEEIANYYKKEKLIKAYKKSKSLYDFYLKKEEKMDEKSWNRIAKERGLLSSESMKYIGDILF